MTNGVFKGIELWRPASISAGWSAQIIWFPFWDIQKNAPIQDALSLTTYSYPIVLLGISSLFLHSGPSAIFWFIVAIVVISFNRVPRGRSRAHVGKKIIETFKPSLANLDPSSSVTGISIRFWIITTSFHFAPNTPFSALAQAMCKTVLSVSQSFSSALFLKATTAKSSFSNVSSGSYDSSSTLALTKPHRVSRIFFRGSLNHSESLKLETLNIECLSHQYRSSRVTI